MKKLSNHLTGVDTIRRHANGWFLSGRVIKYDNNKGNGTIIQPTTNSLKKQGLSSNFQSKGERKWETFLINHSVGVIDRATIY